MEHEVQKDNKQDKYTLFLIVASCVCLIVQLYSMPRENTQMMSLANHGLLLLWYGMAGMRIVKQLMISVPHVLLSVIWVIVMMVFVLLISVVESPSSLSPNFISFLKFLILPVMLLYTAIYPIPQRAKTLVLLSNIVLSIIFIQLYHSDYRNVFETNYGLTNIDAVTLGYNNPNQTAMYLFVCIICLASSVFYFKKPLVKLLLCVDIVYLCWMLYQTECRTALMLVLVFAGILITSFKTKPSRLWVKIAIFAPLVYALFAMFFISFFGNVTLWGESLFNGREEIYRLYLDRLNLSNFLFGDLNNYHFDNMHNSYVSIAASAGIFTVTNFVLLLKGSMEKNYPFAFSQKYTKAAFIGFLCIILYSSTEAAFFVAGSSYAYLIFTVFLLFSQPYAMEPINEVPEL